MSNNLAEWLSWVHDQGSGDMVHNERMIIGHTRGHFYDKEKDHQV